MAAQYKTRCPHCQAQFRISEEHLKQAQGQVRCGSCLKVFLATENLVNEAPAQPKAKPAAQPAAKPAAKTPAPAKAKPASPENWSLPAESKAVPAPEPASRWTMDDGGSNQHESEDIPAFSDDEVDIPEARPAPNDTKVSLGSIELSDSFMSLDEDDNERLRDEDFTDMAGAGRKGDRQSHDSDESWAEALLEELDGSKAAPVDASAMSLDETEDEAAARQAREQKKKKLQAAAINNEDDWAQDATTSMNEAGFDFLQGDDDEVAAIELPKAEKKKSAPQLKLDSLVASSAELLRWGALSALMLVLFSVQYLSFNFSTLARTPEWRGFYTTVCQTFGCQLPNASNLDMLRGANLVVRKHPAYSSALIVDVLLFNRADYEQPFPVLELGFTTLQGKAVASRRFSPDEYLHGDLASQPGMPIDTPVHVSLEILDPGEDAVNYTLRFLPAPSPGS